MAVKSHCIRISIDRGGTFTDVHAAIPGRDDIILKLLSVDPANYKDAPTEGIRRILELVTDQHLPRGQLLDLFHVESIRMGTTVATNALLERKGERVALVTKGFRDLLAIGNQSRPNIFDLSVSRPEVLFESVVEIDERITMEDYTEDPESSKTTLDAEDADLATAITGETAILSGPAGGVVGYAQTSWDAEERCPIIGFDMGGTSTDVSRYAGVYDHVFETTTAGIAIQSPQLDIHTVAAGGGSILTWKNGLFNVGPESASAHPGPACYRKGGPLTVTDANLFLGRLLPEYFPKVFGPEENEPLNREVAEAKFIELTNDINQDRKLAGLTLFSPEEVALGFLKVANEGMAEPIRALTEARGYEAADHYLACFGGAGGQHACSVASVLGISRIIIHKYSSILSAYGMSLADVVHEIQRPAAITYTQDSEDTIREQLEALAAQATVDLTKQGFAPDRINYEAYLNMRYAGSSSSLMVLKGADWNFGREFEEAHKRGFGFHFPEKAIIVDHVRIRAIGVARQKDAKSPFTRLKAVENIVAPSPRPSGTTIVYFEDHGHLNTPIYELEGIPVGARIAGPAMIIDNTQTILVTPGVTATTLDSYVIIDSALNDTFNSRPAQEEFSPIQLTVFGRRFMSIAEQMGRTLQKTAVSTNIKERLDFSCAISYQHKLWEGRLRDGDVLVSNHPSCGGTRLPDITVITPVFEKGDITFYVASRGHHSDIGGILPGSMPPTSFALWQEGASIESTKLVSEGRFDEDEVRRLLLEEPAKYEGCSGTRRLQDNISDLKAQIAANAKGILLIKALIAEFGVVCVHRYMYAIQYTAEDAVRGLMKSTVAKFGSEPLTAVDYMDDGTPISLKITISPEGSATFDFAGTGPQVLGNTNAPMAITHSAIIYCLRGLISSSVPLNQGCLAPINIKIPEGSILNPGAGLAVVGGNVLTSQRVTDVVLRAFRACAASQGCCNNLTFGTGGKDPITGEHKDGFGYYETIAGGAGSGPTWHGQSGVHTHMTNTRITDPEVFEKRYPCILRRFELRQGSGGKGRFNGGDGTIREIEFRVPVQCSILSERRSRQPYGMEGGGDGKSGINLVIVDDVMTGKKKMVNLGGKATTKLLPGECHRGNTRWRCLGIRIMKGN
ncbi:hypothetical protein QQZ08_004377 [Neonectria magnoliae]|uniref:5-oxoprolinase n=1 Tax=Neonectria magnoliae TaxID=2732573 RepID=A0ABR1I6G0_9HYPO